MFIYKENLKFIFNNLIEEIWKKQSENQHKNKQRLERLFIDKVWTNGKESEEQSLSYIIAKKLPKRKWESKRSKSSINTSTERSGSQCMSIHCSQLGGIKESDKDLYISSNENLLKNSSPQIPFNKRGLKDSVSVNKLTENHSPNLKSSFTDVSLVRLTETPKKPKAKKTKTLNTIVKPFKKKKVKPGAFSIVKKGIHGRFNKIQTKSRLNNFSFYDMNKKMYVKPGLKNRKTHQVKKTVTKESTFAVYKHERQQRKNTNRRYSSLLNQT